jgi:hypothetical protein
MGGSLRHCEQATIKIKPKGMTCRSYMIRHWQAPPLVLPNLQSGRTEIFPGFFPRFLRALADSSGAGMLRYRFARFAVCCPATTGKRRTAAFPGDCDVHGNLYKCNQKQFWRARTRYVRAQTRYVRAQTRYVRAQTHYVRAQTRYVRAQTRYVHAQTQYVRAQTRYVRAQTRYVRAQKRSGRAQKRSGNSLNHLGIASSCRICNAAAESISIFNAEKTADIFNISGMTKLRITNAYMHDCRIENSAGRVAHFSIDMQPLTGLFSVAALFTVGSHVIPFGLIFIIACYQ